MYQRFELSVQDRQTIANGVSCATILEDHNFLLVKEKTTKRSLKYRNGNEHIIVNHGGKGWWDAQRPRGTPDSSGDVFALFRRLNPDMPWHEVAPNWGRWSGSNPKGPPLSRRRSRARMSGALPNAGRRANRSIGAARYGTI